MVFPTKTTKEVETFSRLVRLMNILETNLVKGYVATRRDVFYQDVDLFQSQTNVDRLMELLTRSMGLTGDDLGAVASQKGIFYGSVTLKLYDGTEKVVSCGTDQESSTILIPRLSNVAEIHPTFEIDYILIVEKEAVFNALATNTKDEHKCRRIVITAKGFPDVLSRSFVHKLTAGSRHTPVFGFSDFDPYGLNILHQFRTGGNIRHNNAHQAANQSCTSLQLTAASIADFPHRSCCLTLSKKDFLQCRSMLTKWNGADLEGKWRVELQRMMFFGKKAELNVIKTDEKTTQLSSTKQEVLGELELVHYINEKCATQLFLGQKRA